MTQTMGWKRTRGVVVVQRGFGYAAILALLPVLMMYKVPYINLGLSTVLIAVSMLYAGVVIISRHSRISFSSLLPIYLYAVWNIIKSDGNVQSILLCVAIMVHLTAMSTKVINKQVLKKLVIGISCLAAIAVIIQQLMHTVFSIHIPMISTSNLLDSMSAYIQGIRTGVGTVDTGYRPSAIFLEPSHFSNYCFIGLGMCLMDKEVTNTKKAILISLGVLCTTSGIGIALVIAAWGYYFLVQLKTSTCSKKMKRFFTYSSLAIVAVVIAARIPTVQYALSRIFTADSGSYNAIYGRLFWWDTYMKQLSGTQLIFGLGEANLPDVYFTGIMKLVYGYGIIGTVLFYGVLISFFKKGDTEVRFFSLMLGVMMVFANFTGFVFIIFYFGIVMVLLQKERNDLSVVVCNTNSSSHNTNIERFGSSYKRI